MSSRRKASFWAAVLVRTVTVCVFICFRATAESVFILKMQSGPNPVITRISLSESKRKIAVANPSAIAVTSASGAEAAIEVCLLEAH